MHFTQSGTTFLVKMDFKNDKFSPRSPETVVSDENEAVRYMSVGACNQLIKPPDMSLAPKETGFIDGCIGLKIWRDYSNEEY